MPLKRDTYWNVIEPREIKKLCAWFYAVHFRFCTELAATAVTIEKLRKFGVEIGAMTINLATLFHRSHGDCGASAKCFETI